MVLVFGWGKDLRKIRGRERGRRRGVCWKKQQQ
jgi:hypothetical protein